MINRLAQRHRSQFKGSIKQQFQGISLVNKLWWYCTHIFLILLFLLPTQAAGEGTSSDRPPTNTLDDFFDSVLARLATDSLDVSASLDSLLIIAEASHDVHLEVRIRYHQGLLVKKHLNFRRAGQLFEPALAMAELNNFPREIGLIERELGAISTMTGNNVKALGHYLSAIEAAEQVNDYRLMGACYSLVGNIFRVLGDYNKAIEYTLVAEKNYKKIDFKEGAAWILYSLGTIYNNLELKEDAERSFLHSLELYEGLGYENGDSLGIAICNDQLGLLQYDQDHLDQANRYFDLSYEIYVRANNQFGLARTLKNKGLLENKRQNYAASLELLSRASEISYISQDVFLRPVLNKYMGLALMELGQPTAALDSLKSALAYARSTTQRKMEGQLLGTLGEFYFQQGNLVSAIDYFRIQSTLNDSIQAKSSLGRVADLVNIYEMAQNQEELKDLRMESQMNDLERERQRSIQLFWIMGTLAGILFSLVLAYFYRDKQKLLKQKVAGELRYRQIFNTNQAIKLIVDPVKGEIVEANEAAVRFYGYSMEQLTSMKVSEINGLSTSEIEKTLTSITAEERLKFNFIHRLASGEHRNVEVFSGPIDLEGQVLIHSIIHDITEREQAKTRLKKSEEEFRLTIERSPIPMILNDGEDKLVFVNEKFKELYGYELDELADGDAWWTNLYPDQTYRQQVRESWKKAASEAKSPKKEFAMQEWRVTAKSGEVKPTEFYMMNLEDMSVVVMIDVSDRVIAQDNRLNFEKRLSQSQKLEALGTMVGGVAHEFNNILQSIFLYTELVGRDLPDNQELREDFQHIIDDSRRAKTMIDHILTFSRKDEIKLLAQDLAPIIEESLGFARASMPAKIEFTSHIQSGTAAVLCDKTQIHQIIINLCNNAKHALGDKPGMVGIHLRQALVSPVAGEDPREMVVLKVTDNGSGMNKDTISRIFDPFFTTKEIGEGTGLGLSVIHGIIKMMNGYIHVSSIPDQITTFTIYLPIAEGYESAFDEAKEPDEEVGSLRILIADDEESIRDAATVLLQRQGYSVRTAEDGELAFKLIQDQEQRFDLLILDQSMPKMSGLELATAVRKLESEVPIIISSGLLSPEEKEHFGKLGIHDFLSKPWTTDDLNQIIKKRVSNIIN